MRAEANVKDFSEFKLQGELATLEATVNQVGVRSIGSAPFQYQDNLLRLERLRLEQAETWQALAHLERRGELPSGREVVIYPERRWPPERG